MSKHDKIPHVMYQRAFLDTCIMWYLAVNEKRPVALTECLIDLVVKLPGAIPSYSKPPLFQKLLDNLTAVQRQRTVESISKLLDSLVSLQGSPEYTADNIVRGFEEAAGVGSWLSVGIDRAGITRRVKHLHMLREFMSTPTQPDSVKKAALYLPQVTMEKPMGMHCACCKYHNAKEPAPAHDPAALTEVLQDLLETYDEHALWSLTKKEKKRPAPSSDTTSATESRIGRSKVI